MIRKIELLKNKLNNIHCDSRTGIRVAQVPIEYLEKAIQSAPNDGNFYIITWEDKPVYTSCQKGCSNRLIIINAEATDDTDDSYEIGVPNTGRNPQSYFWSELYIVYKHQSFANNIPRYPQRLK